MLLRRWRLARFLELRRYNLDLSSTSGLLIGLDEASRPARLDIEPARFILVLQSSSLLELSNTASQSVFELPAHDSVQQSTQKERRDFETR